MPARLVRAQSPHQLTKAIKADESEHRGSAIDDAVGLLGVDDEHIASSAASSRPRPGRAQCPASA